jgi:tRNA pseudouridine55 synthase
MLREARMMTMPPEGASRGWIVIDKPLGISSNGVVMLIRGRTRCKVGHAGTLDPWATGVLPIALGEATKTVAYAMQCRKSYRFRIRWGVERTTDDREGAIVSECPSRPSRAAIETVLPGFTGTILQSPPAFSAVKVVGRRAYALARAGAMPNLPPRPVQVHALRLIAVPDRDHAELEALVGKGTYIRALARDLGRALATLGHVTELRRLAVGWFTEKQAISLATLLQCQPGLTGLAEAGYLLPIEAALNDIPAVTLSANEAVRLCCGQRLALDDVAAPVGALDEGTVVAAYHAEAVVALAKIENGGLRPARIIHR